MMFRIWIVCLTALVGPHAVGDDGITYLDEPLQRNGFVRPRVVDVETGRLFVGRPERRDVLVLSPDGNGREIPVGGHSAAIGIGYVDGSKVLIVSCRSALVLIFDAETLDLKRRFMPTATASVVSLATSKGGSFALFHHDRFRNQYNTWPIWQLLDTKKQLTTPRIGGTAAVSHDGRHLFAFAASRSYPNHAPRLHKLAAEHLNWESENELLRALAEKSSAFATVEVPKKQPGSAKREPARIVVDPAGNYVSVDENIFDADTLGHIGTLSTPVGAFVPNKPIAATIASRALRFEKIGSTADGPKPIARQPLGPEWFPTYERAGNNAAISIGGGFAVVHNGDRAKFFPLDAFELPGTPLLRLKVTPPKRLFVEQPIQFPVEAEPGTQVEVLDPPEGFTLENGKANWTPSLKQLGQHSVKVRLRNGDEEAERTFQLAVSHPILPGSDMRGFVRSGPFGRRFVAADTMRGGEVVLLTRDGKELLRTRARISRSDRERAPGDLILGPDALWIFPGGGRAATRYPIADDNTVGQPQQVVFRAAHGSSWRRGRGRSEELLLMSLAASAFENEVLAPAVPGEPRRLADRFTATTKVRTTIPSEDMMETGPRAPIDGIMWEHPPEGGLGKPVLLVGQPGLWRLANPGKPPREVGIGDGDKFTFWGDDRLTLQPILDGADLDRRHYNGDGADLVMHRYSPASGLRTVSRIPVIRGDRTRGEKELMSNPRLDSPLVPVYPWEQIRFSISRFYVSKIAKRGRNWFLVDVSKHGKPAQDAAIRLVRRQSTFVLPWNGKAEVRYETVGETAQFKLASNHLGQDRKPYLLESTDGTFEIDTSGAVTQMNMILYQLYHQGGKPEREIVNQRARNFADAVRPLYESITGQPMKGFPIPIRVFVTAVGKSLETDTIFHDFIIDVPIKDILALARGRLKK